MSLSVDPRIGSELFGYRVEALLGRGGMSVVYRAHDLALDRKVALKLLASELAGDDRFRARFLRESRVAASLDHPNVVPIYEAGEAEGLLCIAMRYVEGTDLKRLLREEGALEPDRALDYCAQVAAALDAAHEHGLVHRDVKPSNVLITRSGHCYLADFGLTYSAADRSDLTQTGHLVGTVDYAAPEQIEGKAVDGRADVYSLGCLLYECLAGSVPFAKDSDLAVLWAHVNDSPPDLASYPELEPVLKRAMAKRPDDRYPTCGALVTAGREALPKPGAPPGRRRPALIAVGVVATLLIVAAVVAGLLLSRGGGPKKPSSAPTLAPKADSLQRIDPRTNKLVATIAPGAGAEGIAVGDGAVFVASTGDQTVSRIDPKSNAIVKRVAAAGPPTSIALGRPPDGPVLWVVSQRATALGSGLNQNSFSACSLSQLDPKTLSTNYTLNPTGNDNACGPVATRDGTDVVRGQLRLPRRSSIRTSVEAIRTVRTGRSASRGPHGLAVGAGAVWLASPFTEELYRFDRAQAGDRDRLRLLPFGRRRRRGRCLGH